MDFLVHHFVSSPESAFKRPWTLLTSNFPHRSIYHLVNNMGTLWLFSAPLIRDLQSGQRFLELYACTRIGSVMLCAATRFVLGQRKFRSICASGALLGVLAAQVALRSDQRHDFRGFDMTNLQLTYAYAAFDLLYAAFDPHIVSSASHLGGACSGALYALFVKDWKISETKAGKSFSETAKIFSSNPTFSTRTKTKLFHQEKKTHLWYNFLARSRKMHQSPTISTRKENSDATTFCL